MNTDKIFAEAIANEYAPKEASKVVALRKLDKKARIPAEVFAYTWGIAFALVLGTGMCFAMGTLGNGSATTMAVGIAVGVLGIAGAGVNYPLYKKILEKNKQKYAGDIIRLANEISSED